MGGGGGGGGGGTIQTTRQKLWYSIYVVLSLYAYAVYQIQYIENYLHICKFYYSIADSELAKQKDKTFKLTANFFFLNSVIYLQKTYPPYI